MITINRSVSGDAAPVGIDRSGRTRNGYCAIPHPRRRRVTCAAAQARASGYARRHRETPAPRAARAFAPSKGADHRLPVRDWWDPGAPPEGRKGRGVDRSDPRPPPPGARARPPAGPSARDERSDPRIAPEEIAPWVTPSRNGVTRLAPANTPSHHPGPLSSFRWYAWKAKADPLRTIPASTSVSGTNRAGDRSAYALGNAVNRPTTATMSQMWC